MNSYTADVILCSYDSNKDMANQFSAFFLDKIDQIRADLDAIQVLSPLNNSNDNNTLPPESLFDFGSVNDKIVSKIIRNSPVKPCSLDPLPTHHLKHMKQLVSFKLLKLLISRLLQGPSHLHTPNDKKSQHLMHKFYEITDQYLIGDSCHSRESNSKTIN